MNAPPPPALELVGLTKQFGTTLAADHVDLTVPAGSFFGLVGPNGAGKTTSLSMAVGLLRPDSGTAPIFGVDVWRDPVARQGAGRRAARRTRRCPSGSPARELLTYMGLLRGLRARRRSPQRADELLRGPRARRRPSRRW